MKNPGAFPLETGSGQELRRMYDHRQQHIRALKFSGVYNIETYLTAAIELKLDENTKLRWTEHSSKCEKTPPREELLVQARHHESVIHSARYAQRPNSTSKAAYTAGCENVCVACKKENHPLNTCGRFQSMSREERWALVKKERVLH